MLSLWTVTEFAGATMTRFTQADDPAILEAYGRLKSIRAVERETGVCQRAISNCLRRNNAPAVSPPPSTRWAKPEGVDAYGREVVDNGSFQPHHTYIITSAQNNAQLDTPLWENLQSLARHLDARLMVGRFVYNKQAMGQQASEKTDEDVNGTYSAWDPRIIPFCVDERVVLAPGLVWCGHLNILPTAVRPLSDLANYTGTSSAIFPHTKHAMESVAVGHAGNTKFNYTTGAVTLPSYIQRKAGQKAEFHHIQGALIVEVDKAGDWWVRQLNADSDGSFYDLTRFVKDGKVSEGHAVEAVTWGDIHTFHLEDWMKQLNWGEGGVIDQLRPRKQFLHDLLDFYSRSHHDARDPHEMYERWTAGTESVEKELRSVVDFLAYSNRQFCQTYVVESNHDNFFVRWLKEADFKKDHVNALIYLKSTTAVYEALAARHQNFNVFAWAMKELGVTWDVRFLTESDSMLLCPEHPAGGIESAMHGDRGLNGSRGSPQSFAKMGRRLNIGHRHSAEIFEGVFISGVTGNLDQRYNKGPSSWSHTHIITYPNSKRTLVTVRNRKLWR